MKWSAVTVNLSKVRKTGQMLGVYSKTLSMLMIGCFIFFYGAGRARLRAIAGVGRLAERFDEGACRVRIQPLFFMDMMGLEVPGLPAGGKSFTFSQSNVSNFFCSRS